MQVAAKNALWFDYGTGDSADSFKSVKRVQIDENEAPGPKNVEDAKVNAYAISRAQPYCTIRSVCTNNYQAREIKYDHYIPHGNGPKEYETKICGDDGTIKDYTATCEK